MTEYALVLEDQPAVLRGLCKIVQSLYPERAVCAAQTVAAAVARLEEPGRCLLALVDLGLPDGSGTSVITRARTLHPEALVVVATIFDDDEHLFGALAAGADGYLLKEQPAEEISLHLERAREGLVPLSPAIARRVLQHFRAPRAAVPSTPQPSLTARESEVLTWIARGYRVGEVAKELAIADSTVSGYVKDIYRKLNISSRAEAALEASRRGLV